MFPFPFSTQSAFSAALVLAVGAVVGFLVIRRLRARRRESLMAEARKTFHLRREWLEARFVALASSSGRPRGLAWSDCDFADDICFARDRATGNLRALVGVTIRFEAIEGGGLEDVEAVRNLRAATAVFRFEDGDWATDGRAVFNLNPDETIRHFQHELEALVDLT
jgi:hypothetical protein